MVTFRFSGNPVEQAALERIERTFEFEFPDSFRALYLAQNGGKPSPNLIDIDNEVLVVSEIFAIEDSENGLDRVCQDLKCEDGPLPRHLVPFADDPGGDYFCLSTRKEDYGTIWFFRGEYMDEPERAVRKICASLDDFLRRLRHDD